MPKGKKEIRRKFRKEVFERDLFSCVICGMKDKKVVVIDNNYISSILDAHHITNRKDMPNGGYVKENGITLCKISCHLKAEEYLQNTCFYSGFSPKELYVRISSSYEKAYKASEEIK